MNKKILYSVAIAMMVLLAACSSEENIPETDAGEGRTISLTATLPSEPETRVSLEQKSDRTIEVLWEKDDVIELFFLDMDNVLKSSRATTTVNRISDNGRTAHFEIVLPKFYSSLEKYKLYGVFGKGGFESAVDQDTDQLIPAIILPNHPGYATSLEYIETSKDAVLYFDHIVLDNANSVKVEFIHLGSIINVNLLNDSKATLSGMLPLDILGFTETYKEWAYAGTGTFNIRNNSYQTTFLNRLELYAPKTILEPGETMSFWTWLPTAGKTWPDIKVRANWAGLNTAAGTITTRPSRTPQVGKAYYLYTVWDGDKLQYTTATGELLN